MYVCHAVTVQNGRVERSSVSLAAGEDRPKADSVRITRRVVIDITPVETERTPVASDPMSFYAATSRMHTKCRRRARRSH